MGRRSLHESSQLLNRIECHEVLFLDVLAHLFTSDGLVLDPRIISKRGHVAAYCIGATFRSAFNLWKILTFFGV